MPSGSAWNQSDLLRTLKRIRAGHSVSAVAEMELWHRDTVTAMIREAAMRYLAQCETNQRIAAIEDRALDT
jgi:hypothetical protein